MSARRGIGAWVCPLLCLLAFGFGVPGPAKAEVTIEMVADRTKVALGGQLMVEVRVKSDSLRGGEVTLPDFDGFSVLRQSVQRPMQFSFGLGGQQQVQSSTHYSFLLQAERAGTVTIPPASVRHGGGQMRSKALTIEVSGQPPANGQQPPNAARGGQIPQGNAQPGATDAPQAEGDPQPQAPVRGDAIDAMQVDGRAFLRTVVDKGRPFEREQVTVSIYLYTRERLQEAPMVDKEPTTDGFWTQDLTGDSQQQLPPEQIGRARYRVYLLRRFAAFPLRDGELTLGPMELTIRRPNSVFQIFGRGGGGPRKPLVRQSAPVVVEVQPIPEQGRPAGEVSVGRYSVAAELDRTQVATGDAVTLTATIRGYGHLQSVRLETPELEGVQVLQPQTKDLLETTDGHIGGTRIYEWLLVPKQPGKIVIPAFEVPLFDPHSKQYRVARSAPLTLVAAGRDISQASVGGAGRANPAGPNAPGTAAETIQGENDGKPLTWGPIRTESALLRHQQPPHRSGLFWPLLWLPALAFVGILGLNLTRQLAAKRGERPEEAAMRDAREALARAVTAANSGDGGAFFPAASQALVRALEARLGEPLGGDTRPQLRRRLSEQGLADGLAAPLFELLARCDEARFAPAAQGADDLRRNLSELQGVFEGVAGWTPNDAAGGAT